MAANQRFEYQIRANDTGTFKKMLLGKHGGSISNILSCKICIKSNEHDEKVKDRWSRYIGAMGIDAVAKQSKA